MSHRDSSTKPYDPGKPTVAKPIAPNVWAIDSFRTGGAYQVTVSPKGCTCTCPHYTARLAGTDGQCKHVVAVLQQAEWAKAAERAQALTDEQLDRWLRIHTETGNLVVAGAIRFVRAARKQAAARKAHIHSIIDQDAPRPAIGRSVKLWGPTTDDEARKALFA